MKRKSLLFLLLFALIAPWAAYGQGTTSTTVYDGTTTNNHVPAYIYYFDDFTRSQFVIPASDLETLGDGAVISALSFYADQAYPASGKVQAPVDVYLKEVSYTSISAFEATSSATTVYSGVLATGDGNVMTITFTNPYTYHNGNLLIGIENTDDEDYQSVYFYGQTVTGASVSGSNGSSLSGVSAGQQNFIPKTTLTYVPGVVSGCIKPTLGEAEYISEEGASFQWTENGTATQWQLQYSTSADFSNPTTLDRSGIPALAVTGLSSGTTYYFRLRSYCGDGEYSNWSNTVTFKTLCGVYGLPYAYGFEDAGDLECWTVSGSTSSNTGIINASDAPEGSKVFRFYYSEHNAYLISPVFDGTSAGLSVTFQYMNSSTTTGYTEQFQVGYTTNATETDPTAFTYGETIYGQNEWVTYENVFPANTKRIAIKYIYTDGMYLRLDDFTFEAPSSCRKPTDLAVADITTSTATLRWTENGEATAWQVEVTDLDGGQVTTWNASSTTYQIVGLSEDTHYSVRVNPVCDVEKWSDPITFTTPELCPKPTNVAVSDITPMSANVSWNGTASSYNLAVQEPVFFYGFEDAEPWVEDNFAPCTTYDGDGLHTYQITDWTPLGEYQFYGSMMTLQSGVTDFASAHGGELFGGFVAGIPAGDVEHNDDYFILPAITIEDGFVFEFWASSLLDNWGLEHMRVGVYGGNGTITDYLAGSATEYVEVPNGWTKYSYNLSRFAGQSIQLAINSLCPDAYILGIDDIFVGYNTPTAQAVVYNNVTSPYTLELDPETTYQVLVQSACGGDNGNSAWVYEIFTTPSNCEVPSALNVTNLMPTTATLNWTGYQDGYDIRYREAGGYSAIWEEGFENGLDNWTIYTQGEAPDANGWTVFNASNLDNVTNHGGSYVASAWSWSGDAYDADNWLVTPQIDLQGTLKFWETTAGSWPDSYEVLLSTGGNSISDFTTTLREMQQATGEWSEVSIDLSSYAGQQGYIAIHHVSNDANYLFIDDFGLYETTNPGPWIPATTGDLFVDIDELHPETAYEWQVRGENRSCTNGEEEGYTAWSEMGTFTTPGLCDPLATLLIDELTATSITLSWTGYQESYNVRYRIYEEYFSDWFDDGLGNWTEDNTSDNNYTDEVTVSGIYGYIFFVDEEVSGAQTLISTEMEPTTSGTILDFYTASEGNSTYKIGFSSTDNALASFTWSEEQTCVGDGYFHPYEGEVPEGTKYFAIQFVSNDNEEGYLIITGFEVAYMEEWITFEGVNSPYTISGLTQKTGYEVYVQGVCGEGETTDWLGGYFTTPEQTNITQTIELTAGWNWFSAYVEGDAVALLQALENSLGDKGITIKDSDNSTDYYGEEYGWYGELDDLGIANEQMYMINVSESCTVELQGMPANPANHAITINPGWNWIGFPSAEAVSVAVAIAGFPAEEGDILKSNEASTDYYGEEYGWFGELETLEPGQGYQYKYNGTTPQTLIFQTGAKRAATTNTLLLKKQIKNQKHNAISRKTMSTKNGVVYNKFQAKVGYKSIVKNYQQTKLNYKK